MKHEIIEQVVREYIRKEISSYALMINGKWGSGKTFYWNNTLSHIVIENEIEPIYISLNGIDDIELVKQKILIKIWFNNRKKKQNVFKKCFPDKNDRFPKYASNSITFMDNVLKSFLNKGLRNLFNDLDFSDKDNSKYLICFDDFERCLLPKEEVLGLVNYYVEHNSLKVIILTNENEIKNQKESYENLKEKIIYRTLLYQIETNKVIPELIEFYSKNNDYYQLLIKYKDFIQSIFSEYDIQNLRTLIFFFEQLEQPFEVFNNGSNEIIEEILYFSALICFELKDGLLSCADYTDYKKLDIVKSYYDKEISALSPLEFDDRRTTKKIEEEKEEREERKEYLQNNDYAIKFHMKYLNISSFKYFFYPSLYRYMLSGYLNENSLIEEIKNRNPKEISLEMKIYNSIVIERGIELPNEEFNNNYKKLLTFSQEGKYCIYDYKRIAEVLLFYSKNKIIEEKPEILLEIFADGIKMGKKITPMSRTNINLDLAKYDVKEGTELRQVVDMIEEAHIELLNKKHLETGERIIESIKNDSVKELIDVFSEYENKIGLILGIDVNKFTNAIIDSSNEFLFALKESMRMRYGRITNPGMFFYSEKQTLEKLHIKLKGYFSDKTLEQPQNFLIQELIQILENSIKKIERTKNEI